MVIVAVYSVLYEYLPSTSGIQSTLAVYSSVSSSVTGVLPAFGAFNGISVDIVFGEIVNYFTSEISV